MWAGEMLPTKLIMTERERNWKSVWRCLKAMHILIANFHLLANQGEQSHSCYSDTCFFLQSFPQMSVFLLFLDVGKSDKNLGGKATGQNENLRLYKESWFVVLFLSTEYTQRSCVIGCGICKIKGLREKLKTIKGFFFLGLKTRKKLVSLSAPHYQLR